MFIRQSRANFGKCAPANPLRIISFFSKSKRVGETLSRLAVISTPPLQRTQEIQYFLLLIRREVEVLLLHGGGFAATARVIVDCSHQVRGAAIVQEEDALSQPPQWSGAELVAARAALRDIVRQLHTHVVDLEIREAFTGALLNDPV